MTWHDNLVEDDHSIREILLSAKKIAVIGIKDETRLHEAAHSVPAYLKENGFEVFPINPEFDQVFGTKTIDSVLDLYEPVDVVLIFRAPGNVPDHAKEILEMNEKPSVVWMQSGITSMSSAKQLAAAGVKVVQDHCIYRDHLRLVGSRALAAA